MRVRVASPAPISLPPMDEESALRTRTGKFESFLAHHFTGRSPNWQRRQSERLSSVSSNLTVRTIGQWSNWQRRRVQTAEMLWVRIPPARPSLSFRKASDQTRKLPAKQPPGTPVTGASPVPSANRLHQRLTDHCMALETGLSFPSGPAQPLLHLWIHWDG